MSLEPKNKYELKNEIHNINFKFNHIKKTFGLSVEYILDTIKNSNIKNKTLKTIIKEECLRNNIILQEDNIVLYDFENDVFINEINDLIVNKTKSCTIIILPIECNKHV